VHTYLYAAGRASVNPAPGAAAGADAQQFQRGRSGYTVLIADLSTPGMSGGQTLPELRKVRPSLKVLVSSGHSETEEMTMIRGQRWGIARRGKNEEAEAAARQGLDSAAGAYGSYFAGHPFALAVRKRFP
jgi:CheY-like chemotaxis protein